MKSPAHYRLLVTHVQDRFGLSQRRACRALGVGRSTIRYVPTQADRDRELVKELCRLSEAHPRWGYRKIWALLRREGWEVNLKRVHRLWRLHGLQVPRRARRVRKVGPRKPVTRAEYRNHVWSVDFVFDQTMDGRTLKCLTVVDEFTREGLLILVDRRLGARAVRDALQQLFARHGPPKFVRSDNGGEFLADVVAEALAEVGADGLFIEPGSPWQNGTNERFNGIYREELLDREMFGSLKEAQFLSQEWLVKYNTVRPHGSLNMLTPMEFIERLQSIDAPKPSPRA